MKKKIDITNWREVVDFVIDRQDPKASKYSEYMYDRRKFENFKIEVKEQNPSKTQKLTM